MKKSYLKEFQVDIGWVILIFSFKLEVFWRYGSKTNNFPLKTYVLSEISVIFGKIWSLYENRQFFMKIHQTVLHYSEEIGIFHETSWFPWKLVIL